MTDNVAAFLKVLRELPELSQLSQFPKLIELRDIYRRSAGWGDWGEFVYSVRDLNPAAAAEVWRLFDGIARAVGAPSEAVFVAGISELEFVPPDSVGASLVARWYGWKATAYAMAIPQLRWKPLSLEETRQQTEAVFELLDDEVEAFLRGRLRFWRELRSEASQHQAEVVGSAVGG